MPKKKEKELPPCTVCSAPMDKSHFKRGYNVCVWCELNHGPFRQKKAI